MPVATETVALQSDDTAAANALPDEAAVSLVDETTGAVVTAWPEEP
ncbi:hypothetical protein [Streptomyces sp. NPDC021356]